MKMMLVVMVGLSAASALGGDGFRVDYPEGYRDWRHIKSMELKPGHPLYESFGGLHHIYANSKAVAGYRTGQFQDGAVIVFDLLEAKNEGNALVEGKRKVLGVMARDTKRFGKTGGWGFEGFAGGDRDRRVVGEDSAKACFECHAPQRGNNYLFSSIGE
jgi:hypothetical protein